MKITILITRILMGLMFFVFGLNQFFHFIPMKMAPGPGTDFAMCMVSTKYFMPLLGTFQTLCGLSLLINRFVPLALIMLIPINLNIFLFHLFLAPEGMVTGIVVLAINIFLMYAYRDQYLHLKNPKANHLHN